MAECILVEGVKRYPQVYREGKVKYLHRLVCEEHNGPPPTPKHQAMHSCDTKNCIQPEHLSWGTPKRNTLDARERKTIGRQRLRPEEVQAIKDAGRSAARESAVTFGVSLSHVRNILYGNAWREDDGT